ncbi:MAG: hypothetical protein ACYSUI_07440 [Planctomycetota bacterium]|jgi:hypothetical protein
MPKDGSALFEIMRKIGPAGEKAGEPGPRTESPAQPPPSSAETPTSPRLQGDERPAEGDSATADVPALEMVGGQVRIALTSRATAVVVFALGLVLVLAYSAGSAVGRKQGKAAGYKDGRASAQASAVDEIQVARARQPVEGIFDSIGRSPVQPARPAVSESPQAAPAPTPRPEVAWVRDYTYIAVQDFRADARADVERAKSYLLDNGVETAILELKGDWKYRLVTVQGFNRDDPVQRDLADEYLANVRKLGQAYFNAGGRYRLEGYFKKLTADRW